MDFGTILALDLATNTGWAEGRPGERPVCGTLRLGDAQDSHAARHYKLLQFLAARLSLKPALVVYEAALPFEATRGQREEHAVFLKGLVIVTEVVCFGKGLYGRSCVPANVQTVRKHFVGNGRPENPKQVVYERCRLLGWDPANYDEADALAMWDYAAAVMAPKTAAQQAVARMARS